MSTPSIRRRLLALLLFSLVLVWGAMLAYGYRELSHEVDELADARLEQNARTLMLLDLKRLHSLAAANGQELEDGHEERHEEDGHAGPLGFQVWTDEGKLLLQAAGAPDAAYDAHAGHAHLVIGGAQWHAFALRDARHAYQVRVFEAETTRSHLVNEIARDMGQWLLLALPVLALLVWISTTRGLRPLATISSDIGSRHAGNLQPLDLARVPVEIRPLADSLNNLLLRLSESIDRERSFTADAAHELRTPLAAIKVQAEVALAADSEEQRRHALAQVIAGVQRSVHLAQQLLLLARLDHSDAASMQPVDLGLAAADSAARHADEAERKGIELDFSADAGCVLHADPVGISVMIDNLLDNAIKYGRAAGHIRVRVMRKDAQVTISVLDDGPGVAPEYRTRLTSRFFRVPGSGAQGSGLGLAIVERIAVRYRGAVIIGEGLDGTGLGVTVRLPC
jgi:two-component system, OmpR family, sensor histidine kinase QseC